MVSIEKHINTKKKTVIFDWTFLLTAISILASGIIFIAIYIINMDKNVQLIETHYRVDLNEQKDVIKAILKEEATQNLHIQEIKDKIELHTHTGGVNR